MIIIIGGKWLVAIENSILDCLSSCSLDVETACDAASRTSTTVPIQSLHSYLIIVRRWLTISHPMDISPQFESRSVSFSLATSRMACEHPTNIQRTADKQSTNSPQTVNEHEYDIRRHIEPSEELWQVDCTQVANVARRAKHTAATVCVLFVLSKNSYIYQRLCKTECSQFIYRLFIKEAARIQFIAPENEAPVMCSVSLRLSNWDTHTVKQNTGNESLIELLIALWNALLRIQIVNWGLAIESMVWPQIHPWHQPHLRHRLYSQERERERESQTRARIAIECGLHQSHDVSHI